MRKPDWIKVRPPFGRDCSEVSGLLRKKGLHTVCRSARCPNIGECWSQQTAAFMILGDVCTRTCAFCAVAKGSPAPPDPEEPARTADAVRTLGLRYAVITSVTRDDLPDGGAGPFAATIRAVRRACPETRIEALIPDFGGDAKALETVLEAGPDALNHNLETVESLYPAILRPLENYRRSLGILTAAARRGVLVKSGLMVGLGESEEGLRRSFADLRSVGCDLLTIGQYLRPSKAHAPVARYYPPGEFDRLRVAALALGFRDVASGPLVRSSYFAEKLFLSSKRKA
jgi:lipoyl synthase